MDVETFFPILIYILLVVLVILLIALIIRLIRTIDKMNLILDDVGKKLVKVDGLFDLIDHTTDYASNISDKIVTKVSSIVNKFFRRKRAKNKDE